MKLAPQETRHELARRQLLAVDQARGHVVRCEAGELWLTLEGPRDIVLGPGESYLIDGDAPLVISALQDSRFLVAPGEKPSPACRLRRAGAEWTLAGLLRWRLPALAGSPAASLR